MAIYWYQKKEASGHFLRETVRQPKYVAHILGKPDQENTDNSTDYYDTPTKYVVGVLGGPVSKTYRRLPESRNHPQISPDIMSLGNAIRSHEDLLCLQTMFPP